MKKLIGALLFVFVCIVTMFTCAFAASTSDALMNEYYFDLYSELYPNINRPYTAAEGEGTVDVTTGSLFTNVEDYRIEGKNDFDVPFIRSFKTNTSGGEISYQDFPSKKDVEHHYELDFICAEDGERVSIEFYNEMEIMKAGDYFEGDYYDGRYFDCYTFRDLYEEGGATSYTRVPGAIPEEVEEKMFYRYSSYDIDATDSFIKFNSTMKISKPALECYDYEHETGYWTVYLMFQDLQGNTNAIEVEYDTEDSVKEYKGSDVARGSTYSCYQLYAVDRNDISVTETHPAGFVYNMYMLGDDGSKYYVKRGNFYYNYTILAAEDRYGNLYLLNIDDEEYSVTTPENVVYTCNGNGITKTYNGEITELVKYNEEFVNDDILDPDELYTADDKVILTITKNSGTENIISDDEENKVTYYMYQDYRFDNFLWRWGELRYYLPYKITLPSGVEKNIEYEKNDDWHIGCGEAAEYGNLFSVSKYSEKYGDDLRNEVEYIYTKEDYEVANKPQKSYFETVVQNVYDDGVKKQAITNTYDRYGKLLKTKVAQSILAYNEYEYEYNGSSSDSKITKAIETQQSNTKTATYDKTYRYLDNTYLREETNGDYEINYTYHEDGNFIPHETTYMKDANTTVRIENILTEDKNGIATQNTYENDVLVKTVSYTYDTYGNIATETASIDGTNSMVTTYNYAYAPDGGYTLTSTITGIRNADGTPLADIVTTSVYDGEYNLISFTDANGNTTTNTYDMLGRPLTISHPDGTLESYSYDIVNGITTYVAPNGTMYEAHFDAWGNKIKTIAFVDGEEIQLDEYTYDDIGNIVTYKAYSSNTDFVKAEYTYDYLNRPLTESVYDSDENLVKTTTYTYTLSRDSDHKPINTVVVGITGDNGTYAQSSQSTNYRGFVTETKVYNGNKERTTTYTHDYVGNVLTATDPMGNVTSTTYNTFGKPIRVTYADGSSVSTNYNMLGLATEQTDAMGNVTEYFYDNAGRNIKVVTPFDDENSSITKTYYDGNGNVVSTKVLTDGSVNTGAYRTVDNTYNNMNRLDNVAVYPTNNSAIYTRYSYDSLGKPTKVVAGLGASDDLDECGQVITYQYDAFGRLVCTTTPDGLTETAEYDYLGRVTSSTDKAGTVTTYSYDNFNNLLSKSIGEESVSYTYNLLGMPTSMTDSTGTTTYVYNPFGELTTETKGSIIKSYTYDDLGRRTNFDVENSEENIISQTYTYDIMGRLISTASGADTLSYTYDANSNLLTKAHNGSVYHAAQYNKANMPVLTQLYNGTEVADTTHYTYNVDGNLAMSVGTKVSSLYYYDGANRLVHESTWGDGMDYSDGYTYDDLGNRTARVHQDNALNTTETTNYTYNNINQLTSHTNGTDTVSYIYDTVGNMISVAKNGTTEKTYTYDAFNRLATANVGGETSSYTYNGDNLRQTKTVNGVTTNHIYDGANIVADVNDTTTVFLRGMGLALLKNGTTTQVYGITPRGDVANLMTSNGEVTDFTYTAYGEPTSENTSLHNPFGYTGEYTDAETGLVYLRNRYYDPEIGIFITIDPAKDGLNWYAYCSGNPIVFVDPTGCYDRKAAVAYAEKWYNDRNDKFYSYSQDCANFVSQCALAGGIKDNEEWHSYKKEAKDLWWVNPKNWFKESGRYNWDNTEAWRLAEKQYEYFSDSKNGYINGEVIVVGWDTGVKIAASNLNVQPGDLMYFAGENGDEVHHAVIVTKVDENEIYYAGHTSSAYNKPLSQNLNGEKVLIVRIKDDAE